MNVFSINNSKISHIIYDVMLFPSVLLFKVYNIMKFYARTQILFVYLTLKKQISSNHMHVI